MSGSPVSPTAKRIVCVGDSLTVATGSAELDKWPVRIALALEKESPGEHSLFIRAWNGATTFEVLQKITSEVGYLLPATVIVTLGVNDAHVPAFCRTPQVGIEDFASNLREIHRLISDEGGNTIFVVEHVPVASPAYSPGNGRTYAENFAPYRAEILKVAGELNVPAFDIPSLMAARGIGSRDIVTDDGLHLSRNGNWIYAGLIFSQLRDFL